MRRDSEPWQARAACRDHPDVDTVFFPVHSQGRGVQRASQAAFALCDACPVARECLTEVLAWEHGLPMTMRHGVYAATRPSTALGLRRAWQGVADAFVAASQDVTVSVAGCARE